jgi:hypothetical protein
MRALPRMRVFWLCLTAGMFGLGLVSWLYHLITGTSFNEILLPVLFALALSVFLLLLGSYHLYTGKRAQIPQPSALRIAKREVIATIPVVLGTIAVFYFLTTSKFEYIFVTLIASLGLWLLLRFLLQRSL